MRISERYNGVQHFEYNDRRNNILKMILSLIGNQCRDCNTGEMCSLGFVRVIILAAMFWIRFSLYTIMICVQSVVYKATVTRQIDCLQTRPIQNKSIATPLAAHSYQSPTPHSFGPFFADLDTSTVTVGPF